MKNIIFLLPFVVACGGALEKDAACTTTDDQCGEGLECTVAADAEEGATDGTCTEVASTEETTEETTEEETTEGEG